MSQYGHEFWTSESEYHELARQFERDIEIVHPKWVTTDRLLPYCLNGDNWISSSVTYYEHRP